MISFGRDTRSAVVGALRLRRWALERLLRDIEAPPPREPASAWQLFLQAESCAVLLEPALRDAADAGRLSAQAQAVYRTALLRELQRAMSARSQLPRVRQITSSHGLTTILLKSSVDIALGRNVAVADVDVLARPDDAKILAESLDEIGYSSSQAASRMLHLAARVDRSAVPLEVHTAVLGFDSPDAVPFEATVPVPGFHPLRMLAPHDHVWTVLCQATRAHPDRRRRLRDLVLLRTWLAAVSPEGMRQLTDRIRRDVWRAELEGILHRVGSGTDRAADARAVARTYLAHARLKLEAAGQAGRIVELATLDFAACGYRGNSIRRWRIPGRRPLLRMLQSTAGHTLAAWLTVVRTLDVPLVLSAYRSRPGAEHDSTDGPPSIDRGAA